MRKTAFLVGLALTILSIFKLYTPFYYYIPKILPGDFDFPAWIALMGIGLALVSYNTLSRRRLLWLVLLMVSLISVFLVLFPPSRGSISAAVPTVFLFCIFFTLLTSIISIIILYLLKIKPAFKLLLLMFLAVLMVFFMYRDLEIRAVSSLNPYDIPLRDKMYTELGWTHCGDFYIQPNPGVTQKVSWRKALHENESIACYFRIKIADSDRPWAVIAKYTIKYKLKCLRSEYVFGIHEAMGVFPYVERKESIPIPYSRSNPSASEVEGISEFSAVTQRIDVLTSYKGYPSHCPGEVSFDIEITLLWKM
jgi:hypothetical protein